MTATNIQNIPESLQEISTENTRLTFDSYRIDLSDNYPEPHPLFKVNGQIVCSPQNLGLLKAKQKGGKTFLCSMFAVSWLSGEYCGIESKPLSEKTVCVYTDSEQSTAHTHKFARRVHRLAGLNTEQNTPNFEVYNIKDLETVQRIEFLEWLCLRPEIGFVILDGIVDLLLDFNDLKESSLLKDKLLRIVKQNNIHILNIIHVNKQDSNSRGHLGAMLEQKAETVFQIDKDNNYFEVSPALTRNAPFEPFGFVINESGLPIPAGTNDRPNPRHAKQQKIFSQILAGQTQLRNKELTGEYIKLSGCSERTAKTHIAEHLRNGFLVELNGFYRLKIPINE